MKAQTVEKTPLLCGQRFSRWTVLERAVDHVADGSKTAFVRYFCVCDCGTFKIVRKNDLKNGRSQTCGCLWQETGARVGLTAHRTHGMSTTRVYKIWTGMMKRCRAEDDPAYKHYGGRGICVCERWHTFENFVEDMGVPEKHQSLDRIDTNADYCKENCRWASDSQQAQNTRQRKDNTSGRTGVYYDKKDNVYRVHIMFNKRQISGGTFKTFAEAVAKREELELLHHGRVRPDEYEKRPDLQT